MQEKKSKKSVYKYEKDKYNKPMIREMVNLVDVYGGTRYRRELAEQVIQFCIGKMLPRIKTLDIMLELEGEDVFEDGTTGCCYALGHREFKMEICANQTEEDFIRSICHEMVHIKQYIRDEFIEEVIDYQTMAEYYNLPSEKEAYSMEEELYKEWLQVNKKVEKF